MRDFRDAKVIAKTLRDDLAQKNLKLGHSESLELVSRLFGCPNWNVLSARIERAARAHLLAAASPALGGEAPQTPAISPFFIVGDVARTVAFYSGKLGFSVGFQDPPETPFFAVIHRDGAQIFLKSEHGVAPTPNSRRHPHLRWDAYIYAPDPDALYADFQARGAPFSAPLMDTHDGLRGFEISDPDGFVLFFGRPR